MDRQQYIDELVSGNIRHFVAKLEWFDIDYTTGKIKTTGEDIRILEDGNLTINTNNGSRRTVSLTFVNENNSLLPNKHGFIWFGKGFKLYTGLKINGENYFNSQGLYLISDYSISNTASEHKISINGIDLFGRLDGRLGGKLDETFIIPSGKNVYDSIKYLFEIDTQNNYTPLINLGAGKIRINPKLKTKTAPYDFEGQFGSTVADLLIDIASAFSQEVYFDTNGNLIVNDLPQQTLITPKLSIGTISNSNSETEKRKRRLYVNSTINGDLTQMYNKWTVNGEGLNGVLTSGIAQDNNPLSPTFVSKIGVVANTLEDSNIYTNALCELRAKYELRKSTQLYNSIDITMLPVDILDVNDTIWFTEEYGGYNHNKIIINSINLPLRHDATMTINCSDVRDIVDVILF